MPQRKQNRIQHQHDKENVKEQIAILQKDWGSVLPKIKAGLNQVHSDPQEALRKSEIVLLSQNEGSFTH